MVAIFIQDSVCVCVLLCDEQEEEENKNYVIYLVKHIVSVCVCVLMWEVASKLQHRRIEEA